VGAAAVGVDLGVGVMVGVGATVEVGVAPGEGEPTTAAVPVAVGETLGEPRVEVAGGLVVTTMTAVGAVDPPPNGGRPSAVVATTMRARATSPIPTIDRSGRGFLNSSRAGPAVFSLARSVPRT
jgi:hypothetical protein